jgi:hypothetical protein
MTAVLLWLVSQPHDMFFWCTGEQVTAFGAAEGISLTEIDVRGCNLLKL